MPPVKIRVLPHHSTTVAAALSVSPRGHLTWWDDPDTGPRRLLSDLPIGRVHALGRTDERLLWVLIHRRSDKRLILCTSDDGSSYTTLDLEAVDEVQTAWALGRVVVVLLRKRVVAYGLDGQQVGELTLPDGARWCHGPFILIDKTWKWIRHSGHKPYLEQINIDFHPGTAQTGRPTEIEGWEGTWLVEGLNVWSFNKSSRPIQIPSPAMHREWQVSAISRNGLRMIFHARLGGGYFGYDLSKKQHFKGDLRLLEPGILAWTEANRGVLAHTTAISVDEGRLRVHNQRENVHIFGVHDGALRLRFAEKRLTSKGKRLELTPGGKRLRRWHRADHNNVVVFLDGSGLLHLTDTTSKLPAIALVLADGDTACWCSEGWMHGPRRFLGPQASAPAAQVATLLDAYVRRLA